MTSPHSPAVKFLDKPCGGTTGPPWRILLEAALRAPSADNSQPWRFRISDGGFNVRFAPRGDAVFHVSSAAVRLAAGAMHEYLIDFARHYELGMGVEVPILNDDTVLCGCIETGGARLMSSMTIIDCRHTDRGPYLPHPVPQSVLPAVGEVAQDVRIVAVDTRPACLAIANEFRRLAEVRFRIRVLHEWLMGSLRFGPAETARGDGLDVALLGLPLGGAQLMRLLRPWSRMQRFNRFGLYKAMAAIDARPLATAPMLLIILGRPEPASMHASGRQMIRAWHALNGAGYAVHPYFAATDLAERLRHGQLPAELVPHTRAALGRLNDIVGTRPEEIIMMVMRVGKPMRPVQGRASRLPVDRLVDIG